MLRAAFRSLALLGLLLGAAPAFADSALFLRPPAIEPRVAFWTRIYTEVDTRAGLIHDTENLAVVYEAVSLPKGLSSRARERRIDGVRDRYRAVLRSLAAGKRSGLSSAEKRVLSLFPPGVSNDTLARASKRVRFQLGQADKFRAGLRRMGRWEDYIRQVLLERGLPTELVALPHVESSFDPKAVSHAGASGIWQFTRSTGRRFMRVDHVVDERRDPLLSTVAAARLLKQNYESIGSWPLAITAYNHGAAGMRRAVRKLGTEDIGVIIDRYRSRSFGFASRNFYASFLAALQVEQNPERYFGPVQKDPREDPEIVVLEAYYKAGTLANRFGLSTDELRRLNPALLRPVWSGDKLVPPNYGLRLPAGRSGPPGEAVLASLPASERFSEQVRDQRYRVKRGDTLSKIARRFRVRERDLMRANKLRNRNRIRVGQTLEIPGRPSSSARTAKAKPVKSTSKKGASPRAVAKATPTPKKSGETIPADGLYRVRSGDNLDSIARRFGVSANDLAAANRIRNRNRIRVGQVLKIPGGSNSARGTRPGVYTVRRGDTLEGIARRFGVSQRAILELNGLRNRHRIQAGQRLYLPGGEPPAKASLSQADPALPAATPPAAGATPPAAAASTASSAPIDEIASNEAPEPTGSATPMDPGPADPTPTDATAATPNGSVARLAPAPTAAAEPGALPLASELYALDPESRVRVQPDETLGHYAEWLEITASSLRRLNDLRSSRSLRLGQRLRLDFSKVSAATFEERRRAHHRSLQERFYGAWQVLGTRDYVLRKGDTLWALSQGSDGVPAWLLLAYNPGVDFGQLRAGQQLRIPRLERRPPRST